MNAIEDAMTQIAEQVRFQANTMTKLSSDLAVYKEIVCPVIDNRMRNFSIIYRADDDGLIYGAVEIGDIGTAAAGAEIYDQALGFVFGRVCEFRVYLNDSVAL